MKKLLLLSLVLISALAIGQDNKFSKFSVNPKFGIAIPVQGSYLKDNCQGAPYFGLDVILKTGLFDYYVGNSRDFLKLYGNNIEFVSPHIGILHNFNFGKFSLSPSFSLGYTWFSYGIVRSIPFDPAIVVQGYSQKGFNASLDLKISYALNDRMQIGIGDSYLNIFESFGAVEPKPDNSNSIGINRSYISIVINI